MASNSSPSSISVVSWVPNRDMQFPEWAEAGRRLGAMGRCGQWGLGDWIRYGNARFGERYTRAATITGYDVQTLMNMVYVASRFAISRRREKLSWSHHETVAALDDAEQDRWLDMAAAEGLSVADLRVEIRSALRRRKPAGDGAVDRGSPSDQGDCNGTPAREVLVCPKCGEVLPLIGDPARALAVDTGARAAG